MPESTTAKRRSVSPRTLIVACFLLIVGGILTFSIFGASRITSANPNNPQAVALGQQVYAARCASCHGANLEGQPNWQQDLPTGGRPAPPHDETGHTWHHNDLSLFTTVKHGGQATSPAGYTSNMPAFGGVLSDGEIYAVLAYIKSTWSPDIQAAQQQGHQ
jgi:mono/diheme cytochrome c family protein